MIVLLFLFSAKPAHLASFGYVFPWWAVILVVEKATWHSVSPRGCWNDQPIGFPTKGYKQCGTCHRSYQVHITALSCWRGNDISFFEVFLSVNSVSRCDVVCLYFCMGAAYFLLEHRIQFVVMRYWYANGSGFLDVILVSLIIAARYLFCLAQ